MATERFVIGGTNDIEILVDSAASAGAMTVFTEVCGTGYGPPPHVHTREDEFIMPVEGEFEVFALGQWRPLDRTGVYVTRGRLHTWRNAGQTRGTMLFVITPGGFEQFLRKLVGLQVPQDLDRLVAISAEFGTSYPADPP